MKGKYANGIPTVYNPTDLETVPFGAPVQFCDDFLGGFLQKCVANENTVAPWTTTETTLVTAVGLVADAVNGVVQLTIDNADAAKVAFMGWNGQESLSLKQGLIWECRAALHVLPTGAGGELTSVLLGLCGAYNADPDAIDTGAWFRLEGDANILWEADDGTTDDDDNDTGVDAVVDTYHIFRIDATDVSAVKFYIDGELKGTANMSQLTTTTGLVQPMLWAFKTKAAANATVGTLYVDYVRAWQKRS
jgi:hypothetical protein